MDRTFHLTNEFRLDGPEQLTALLCASRHTVAWGPIFPLVDSAFQAGRSLISPRGMIELLERDDSPLRIMARENWLTDRAYRKGYEWEPARTWREDFDGHISKLAILDSAKESDDQKRVIIAKPEQGWRKAEERLTLPDGNAVKSSLNDLFTQGSLPPGIYQRAHENLGTKGRHPAETILRDLYNHQDARSESHSAISALDPAYASLVEKVRAAGVSIEMSNPRTSSDTNKFDDIGEVKDILERITPITNEEKLLKFLGSDHHRGFRQLIHSDRQVSLRTDVLRRLLLAERPESILRAVFPEFYSKAPIRIVIAVADIALLVVSLLVEPSRPWSIVRFLAPLTVNVLQRHGRLPMSTDDKHLESFFYLCFAKRQLTRTEMKELKENLLGGLEEPQKE